MHVLSINPQYIDFFSSSKILTRQACYRSKFLSKVGLARNVFSLVLQIITTYDKFPEENIRIPILWNAEHILMRTSEATNHLQPTPVYSQQLNYPRAMKYTSYEQKWKNMGLRLKYNYSKKVCVILTIFTNLSNNVHGFLHLFSVSIYEILLFLRICIRSLICKLRFLHISHYFLNYLQQSI